LKKIIKKIVPAALRWQLRKIYLDVRGFWYRGNRYHCSGCEQSYRTFLPMKEGALPRPNVICPGCGILERHRLLMIFLKQKTDLFQKKHRVLYFAPEYSLQEQLKKQPNIDYLSTDIDSSLAMQEFDIMDIPHPDNSFSAIFCSHVLAHVIDDQLALQELYRITEKGGFLLLLDPPTDLPKTIEDKTANTPEKRLKLFNQDDRYRIYGQDFAKRLAEPGFEVEEIDFMKELSTEMIEKYRLSKHDLIFRCWKR
jgi:SAM-dependent methyltransferase